MRTSFCRTAISPIALTFMALSLARRYTEEATAASVAKIAITSNSSKRVVPGWDLPPPDRMRPRRGFTGQVAVSGVPMDEPPIDPGVSLPIPGRTPALHYPGATALQSLAAPPRCGPLAARL